MYRMSLLGLLAVVLLALTAGGFGGRGTVAQEDATPVAAGHPLVGAWIIDTDADDPSNAPGVVTVGADGTWSEVDSDGTTGLGAWRATGDRTANLVILYPSEEGSLQVRATVDVAADGQTFTASYTIAFMNLDDQYGPGTATATRLEVEAPGTPVGTFEDLFGAFEGSPEAGTPAP